MAVALVSDDGTTSGVFVVQLQRGRQRQKQRQREREREKEKERNSVERGREGTQRRSVQEVSALKEELDEKVGERFTE